MKLDLEKSLLLVFFALMLWLGLGTLWNHQITHNFPFGYSAADAYQHQVRADWITRHGSYDIEAPEIVSGYEDVLGYYMPGSFHIVAVFTHLSGIKSYDALFFMVFLVSVMAALLMYYGLRRFNNHIAILALPLTTLIFANNFYSGLLVGQWPFVFGTFFLLGSFWAISNLDFKRSSLLIALFVAAVAITHTSELIFVVGFLGVAFFLAVMKKDISSIKKMLVASVLATLASIYYIVIFYKTWGKRFGYEFFVEHINQGFPNVRLFQDFDMWIVFILLIGLLSIYFKNAIISAAAALITLVVITLFNVPSKLTSDSAVITAYALFVAIFMFTIWQKKPEFVKTLSPYMLIIGYSSFVGFGARAFQTRFMWPITLAPLFALGFYKLIVIVKSSAKIRWNMLYTFTISIILTIVIISNNYTSFSTQGTMYAERWQMFEYLQERTEQDATVLFLYGDGYEQSSMLYNSRRSNFLINTNDYIDGLNKQIIKREYDLSRNIDSGPGLPYWKGFLSIGYHLEDPDWPERNNDICRFNYYVFDKVTSRQNLQPLIQYNNFVQQVFIRNGMTEVFQNQATSVVKNNNPGGNCNELQQAA